MNFEAAAYWLLLLALVGAVLFARMGLLADYLLACVIAAVLLVLFFCLDNLIRSALQI